MNTYLRPFARTDNQINQSKQGSTIGSFESKMFLAKERMVKATAPQRVTE